MRIHTIDELININMAAKRIIEVNESSIVDLKAELIRKESQAKKVKLGDVESKVNRQSKKPPVWAKPKKEIRTVKSVSLTKKDDLSTEEQQALQKSRQALEAKSALYEKMAKGEIEDESDNAEDSRFLVDFHKKIYQKGDVDSEHSEEELTSDDICAPSGPDEEWVDYVDSLGRARTCLRKDLKHLQELDKNISDRKSSPPTLLSEDMKRELARQKWELEEEEAASKPVGPVHYQNIRFDEIRNHGVGYYQFSTSEEERQEQMKTLDKLREQTMEQRARVQKLKEKRKAALDARLAKVRERRLGKMIQAGDAVDDKEKSAGDSSTATGEEESKSEKPAEESLPTAAWEEEKSGSRQPDRKASLPEWAKHKIQLPERPRPSSHTDTRSERNAEFAPPSFYYEEDDGRNTNKKTRQETPKLFKQNANDSETPEAQTVGHQVNSATHDQQSQFPQLDQREGESHAIRTPHSVISVPAELPPLPLPPQEYVRAPWAGHQWQPPLNVPPPWQPNVPPPFAPPMQYPWQPSPPSWQPYQVPPPPFMRGGPPFSDPHANWNGNHPTAHSSPT